MPTRDGEMDHVYRVGHDRQPGQPENMDHDTGDGNGDDQHQEEHIRKIRIPVEILLLLKPTAVQHGGGANHQSNGGVVAQQPGPMPKWMDDIGLEGRESHHHQDFHRHPTGEQEDMSPPGAARAGAAFPPAFLGEVVEEEYRRLG